MKNRLKRALELCNESDFFYERFKKEFPTVEIGTLWDVIEIDGLKGTIQDKILNIAPTCYHINGKVFLLGEIHEGFDILREGFDEYTLTELYDITTEIKTGYSYTFYVSDLNFFKEATAEETQEVVEFLESLK